MLLPISDAGMHAFCNCHAAQLTTAAGKTEAWPNAIQHAKAAEPTNTAHILPRHGRKLEPRTAKPRTTSHRQLSSVAS